MPSAPQLLLLLTLMLGIASAVPPNGGGQDARTDMDETSDRNERRRVFHPQFIGGLISAFSPPPPPSPHGQGGKAANTAVTTISATENIVGSVFEALNPMNAIRPWMNVAKTVANGVGTVSDTVINNHVAPQPAAPSPPPPTPPATETSGDGEDETDAEEGEEEEEEEEEAPKKPAKKKPTTKDRKRPKGEEEETEEEAEEEEEEVEDAQDEEADDEDVQSAPVKRRASKEARTVENGSTDPFPLATAGPAASTPNVSASALTAVNGNGIQTAAPEDATMSHQTIIFIVTGVVCFSVLVVTILITCIVLLYRRRSQASKSNVDERYYSPNPAPTTNLNSLMHPMNQSLYHSL